MARRKPQTAATPAELAKALNVNRATAYRWIQHGLPRRDDGTFDLAAAVDWVKRYRSRAADRSPAAAVVADLGTGHVPTTARESAADEYRRIKSAIAAIALRKAEGSVVDRTEVAELLRTRARIFRVRLDALRRRLATLLVGLQSVREIERVIDVEFDELLREAYEGQINDDRDSVG
jgi:hypothetical protein